VAKIRTHPDVDNFTSVHWLSTQEPVYVCDGVLAGGKPCGSRSDDLGDPYSPPRKDPGMPDGMYPGYCVNGCEAGYHELAPIKVIVNVGKSGDGTLLTVELPHGVSLTVWGNGHAAIFTDPDDELGENPDLRIEGGKILQGGWDELPARQAQHQ
jgi:hypothetical protein